MTRWSFSLGNQLRGFPELPELLHDLRDLGGLLLPLPEAQLRTVLLNSNQPSESAQIQSHSTLRSNNGGGIRR